jgi:ParB-like chromosome segregation protein Spo0J
VSWRNRIVGEAVVDPGELADNPANFRRHDEYQQAAMDGSLTELGWIQRVIVNRNTGRIIDGHLRAQLARDAGELVPVVYVDLTESEERLALASIDPIAAMAETDQAALDELLGGIEVDHAGLAMLFDSLRTAEPPQNPGGEGDQGRLDRKTMHTCPNCGHEF